MEIGILGTGRVAQTLAQRWSATGHTVTYGSREPSSKVGLDAPVVSLEAAVADNAIVVNATPGSASLEMVEGIGAATFDGKVLVDVANANTASFELVHPNSSLAEKLQAALPEADVVKSMNTAAMTVMTEPDKIPSSSLILSGDDAAAKSTVARLPVDLGWPDDSIVDLGGDSVRARPTSPVCQPATSKSDSSTYSATKTSSTGASRPCRGAGRVPLRPGAPHEFETYAFASEVAARTTESTSRSRQ
jgi:8-hydroxy-5-deazaflavin:NADPH oxidoreductase